MLIPTLQAQEQSRPPLADHPISVTLQTGFADTFQLTLGGVFGVGPAWQNRVSVSAGNMFRRGDAIIVSGFATTDTPGHHTDWMGAIGYRTRLWARGNQRLDGTFTFERWRLPSVLTGAQDWLAGYAATYASRPWKVPVTVQTNAWTLLHSSLQKGSLVHTQAWAGHSLYRSDRFSATLRHGPQYTYSWNFYGTDGHRVLRYGAALVLARGATSLELGYRRQCGLQAKIINNGFWSALLSRTF